MRRGRAVGAIGMMAAVIAAAAAWAETAAVNRPLLGIAGRADRFERHTGQTSSVRHVFLGWEQGRSWGSPLPTLLAGLRPVPMIHIGTDRGRERHEAITPEGISAGRGDGYLIALNRAIADFGSPVYLRFLAEMNNPVNLHARLRSLGQAPVGRRLPANTLERLTVIWNPIAGMDLGTRNPGQQFYPGDRFVDMVGNDIYASSSGVASYAANEALYRAHPSKPYAIAEWGTSVDDPGFVTAICRFLKTRPRTRLAAYYSPGSSPWLLGDKPRSRAAYRRCVTPLGAR
jgi:hypothetical protein